MIRLLTGVPRPTGAGRYVADLARALPGEVEVFFGRPLPPEEYERTRLGDGFAFDVGQYLAARAAGRRAAERTHVTGEGFGAIYGRATRLVTVHQVVREWRPDGVSHPWHGRARSVWVERNYRRLARLGRPIATDAQATARDLVEAYGVDPARVTTIPLSVDPGPEPPDRREVARRRLGLPTGAFVVAHVSRDDGRKNVTTVLRVWRRFARDHPGSVLVHVGPSAAFASAALEAGGRGLRVHSWVPSAELAALYRAADVLFHPSFLEGFSYPVLEALSVGTPALVSDLEVFREELGPFFFAAPALDESGFLDRLEALARGEVRFDPRALRAHVARNFGFRAFAERYRRLYAEVGLRS